MSQDTDFRLQRPDGPVTDEGVDEPFVRAPLATPLDVEPQEIDPLGEEPHLGERRPPSGRAQYRLVSQRRGVVSGPVDQDVEVVAVRRGFATGALTAKLRRTTGSRSPVRLYLRPFAGRSADDSCGWRFRGKPNIDQNEPGILCLRGSIPASSAPSGSNPVARENWLSSFFIPVLSRLCRDRSQSRSLAVEGQVGLGHQGCATATRDGTRTYLRW